MAVWIEGGDDAARRTRQALGGSTLAPSAVLDGPLAEALASGGGDLVLLVRAGDEPAPLALERLGQAAALAPDANVITCDEDRLTGVGGRHAPRFRPGPSPDRWLACDDSGAMIVVRREDALRATRESTGGEAWRHELALELAGPGGERHAHVPFLLCHRDADRPDPPELGVEAVARILRRSEPGALVEASDGTRAVRRPLDREPSVEVIICFRDRPELLARCVNSLRARTQYENIRLALIDNGSRAAETAELVTRFARLPQVRVISDERPFHFAALNNRAVASSSANLVAFLNNDTEIVDERWLEVIVEEAVRPNVGAVAPMLLYPDGTVQHAGAALGLHGYAGHPFAGLSPHMRTAFGYAAGGTRNWLAVTAACMVVERAKFLEVGGFDESFVVAGNDVDLCLRLTAAGYRTLCVPRVTVLHDESQSRGAHIDPGDFAASERSYGDFRTVGDPFYNPNLTLHATDCSVRAPSERPA